MGNIKNPCTNTLKITKEAFVSRSEMGVWENKRGHGYSFLLLNHDMNAIKRQGAALENLDSIDIRNVPFTLYLFKPY